MKVLMTSTGRAFSDFATPAMLRGKGFCELYEQCFSEYFSLGLGAIAKQSKRNTLFVIPKNAYNTNYELFVNVFPTAPTAPARTMDELSAQWRNWFAQAVDAASQSIQSVAESHGESLCRLYAIQHVGLDELGPYPFSTTYEQLHWHVYGVTNSLASMCASVEFPARSVCELRNTFREPLLHVYHDHFRQLAEDCEIESRTASVVLGQRDLSLDASFFWRERIGLAMALWKKVWRECALCFSDLSEDETGRFNLRRKPEREDRINELVHSLRLSKRSRRILLSLSGRARASRGVSEDPQCTDWATCHRGVNGSIGITHDFSRGTTTLRFAPRTFLVVERVGATDGYFICTKNRGQRLSKSETSRVSALQRILIETFLNKFQCYFIQSS